MKNLWNSIIVWFLSLDFLVKRRAKKAMVYRHNYSETFHSIVSKLKHYPFPENIFTLLNDIHPLKVYSSRHLSLSSRNSGLDLVGGEGGLPEEFIVVSSEREVFREKHESLAISITDSSDKPVGLYIVVDRRDSYMGRSTFLLMRIDYELFNIDNRTLTWVSGGIRNKDLPLSHILREKDFSEKVRRARKAFKEVISQKPMTFKE